MQLDRNINEDGCGKYAVINLRRLNDVHSHAGTFHRWSPAIEEALKTLDEAGCLDWGKAGGDSEFFLIRLKDRSAEAALRAYANDAAQYDGVWAAQVADLADVAAAHPAKKTPD